MGPRPSLLAVIALLLRVALSGAETAEARRMQALHATRDLRVYSTRKRSDAYRRSMSMIYGRPFQVGTGDAEVATFGGKKGKRRDEEAVGTG